MTTMPTGRPEVGPEGIAPSPQARASQPSNLGWTMQAWNKWQTLWRYSPFAFAASELEEPFMEYLEGVMLSTAYLTSFISLVVGGLKVWRSGLWNTTGGDVFRLIVLAAAVFYSFLPLLIQYKPRIFVQNYHTFVLVSRSLKMAVAMWLQKFTILQAAGIARTAMMQDVFITSLVELFLIMPLADPMYCLPGLATQFVMLFVAKSGNGAAYTGNYCAKSALVARVGNLAIAPSLGALQGLPRKALSGDMHCGLVEGAGCSSVLGQIQLGACAIGHHLLLDVGVWFKAGISAGQSPPHWTGCRSEGGEVAFQGHDRIRYMHHCSHSIRTRVPAGGRAVGMGLNVIADMCFVRQNLLLLGLHTFWVPAHLNTSEDSLRPTWNLCRDLLNPKVGYVCSRIESTCGWIRKLHYWTGNQRKTFYGTPTRPATKQTAISPGNES